MKKNTPHDDLFRVTFSMPSEAAAFISAYLPSWMVEGLDLSTLKKEPDSYISEDLRSYFSDVVYSCVWAAGKRPIQISFLLEHKSTIPKNIYIQLLRYLTEAYHR